MDKRITISGGIVALTPPVALGIFEVMGWKMPSQVAIILLTITTTAGMIALVVLLHAIWSWCKPFRSRYGLRVPVFRRDNPNPLQWLIDVAKEQRANPGKYLVATDRIAQKLTRDAKRPYLWVRIWYTNLGVNSLLMNQAEGYASFGNEKLPELITATDGFTNVPPDGGMLFDLRIYIPSELLVAVCQEFDSGEIRQLRLSEVTAKAS